MLRQAFSFYRASPAILGKFLYKTGHFFHGSLSGSALSTLLPCQQIALTKHSGESCSFFNFQTVLVLNDTSYNSLIEWRCVHLTAWNDDERLRHLLSSRGSSRWSNKTTQMCRHTCRKTLLRVVVLAPPHSLLSIDMFIISSLSWFDRSLITSWKEVISLGLLLRNSGKVANGIRDKNVPFLHHFSPTKLVYWIAKKLISAV